MSTTNKRGAAAGKPICLHIETPGGLRLRFSESLAVFLAGQPLGGGAPPGGEDMLLVAIQAACAERGVGEVRFSTEEAAGWLAALGLERLRAELEEAGRWTN